MIFGEKYLNFNQKANLQWSHSNRESRRRHCPEASVCRIRHSPAVQRQLAEGFVIDLRVHGRNLHETVDLKTNSLQIRGLVQRTAGVIFLTAEFSNSSVRRPYL